MAYTAKSTDARDRMGVYQHLTDVPDRYRLRQHAAAYADRDVWSEFVAANTDRYATEQTRNRLNRAARLWKGHMDEHGRHPALAMPEDVETWCADLLDNYAVKHAYNGYWVRVEAFYDWLLWHTEHPHVYQPVLMAVTDPDAPASSEIWAEKVSRRRD
jgi:hypothetical protein